MNGLRSWYSRVLFAAVMAAVIWYVAGNVGEIREHDFQLRWQLLIPAFLLVCAFLLLLIGIWNRLAVSLGLTLPFRLSGRAWATSRLGKYVPGNIGLLLVRLRVYGDRPARRVLLGTATEYLLGLFSMSILALGCLLFAGRSIPGYMKLIAAGGAVLFVILMWPVPLRGLINSGLRLLRRPERLGPEDSIPLTVSLRFVGLYILGGLLNSLAFFLVLRALTPIGFSELFPEITASYWLANIVGMAAVFAPGGIGVREGLLFVILPGIIPGPAVIVGAVIFRVVMVAAELLMALLFTTLSGREAASATHHSRH